MILRAIALALGAGPALAQDAPPAAPMVAERPEARPSQGGDETPAPEAAPPAAEAEATPATTEPALEPSATTPLDPAEPPTPEAPPIREQLAETSDELAACLAELDALDVDYQAVEPVLDLGNPDCGIVNPIRVASIQGVAIDPPAELRCAATLAAGRWLEGSVLPVASRLPDRGALTGLVQGTGYLCRARVGDGTGQLSEHAFGNALDVAAFRFEKGEPLTVSGLTGQGTMEEAFLAAVRGAACLDFTTVLGPGANAEHEDHLHLDVRARDGDFRICQ